MRTIAVINQKVGVGKTTTVMNLGDGLHVSAAGKEPNLAMEDPIVAKTVSSGA